MTLSTGRSVFYGVLDLGLGHATRSLPILREFLRRGWRVRIGSSGRALALLRRELPEASFTELPDYGLTYGPAGADWFGLLRQTPRLLRRVAEEREHVAALLAQEPADLVVSDHRYGCRAPEIPSWLLIHQVRLAAPDWLRAFEPVGALMHGRLLRDFDGILIPDDPGPDGGRLSGRLVRGIGVRPPVHFIGPLADLPEGDVLDADGARAGPDLLIAISGPEPQRTVLEDLVRGVIPRLRGRRVVVLGRTEREHVVQEGEDLVWYDHLDRAAMVRLIRSCGLIVTRPGYSTVMELAEIGARALFIPTPGQTEQVLLARRMQELGWAHSAAQHALDLPQEIARAQEIGPIPVSGGTPRSVERFFEVVTGASD